MACYRSSYQLRAGSPQAGGAPQRCGTASSAGRAGISGYRYLRPSANTALTLIRLLHTIFDDYKDAGIEVQLSGPSRVEYVGRPIGVNLLDNAIRYGQAPLIKLEEGAQAVTMRVLDRGPGIAEEHLEEVFKPFFRIEGSRNNIPAGLARVSLPPVPRCWNMAAP
ncbi:Histidine kinase-, DNA gyrase B-, and HSP90-like ATPase [Pseudomonas flavescens]|uniref:Histidine kinase-, DNA gyrase B-, and HSP90-like ATPase n=1 Tax=Phytopseudomonas flavescens TaxID=29435 RepID=A0A1G7ZL80_9GAMM|nr:Histidine kinase-, DNA gyrase B-, and HSP90-like ATPase [Pseudomonas flavescens]